MAKEKSKPQEAEELGEPINFDADIADAVERRIKEQKRLDDEDEDDGDPESHEGDLHDDPADKQGGNEQAQDDKD